MLALLASTLVSTGCPDEDTATQITLEVDVAPPDLPSRWPADHSIELVINRVGEAPATTQRFQLGDADAADGFPFTLALVPIDGRLGMVRARVAVFDQPAGGAEILSEERTAAFVEGEDVRLRLVLGDEALDAARPDGDVLDASVDAGLDADAGPLCTDGDIIQRLVPSLRLPSTSRFGASVAMFTTNEGPNQHDVAIVGDPFGEGMVYVFERTSTVVPPSRPCFAQIATIPGGMGMGSEFGASVAITTDGDSRMIAFIGAPGESVVAAYIIDEEPLMLGTGSLPGDSELGRAIAVDGTLAVVGAPGADADAGDVLLYRVDGSDLTLDASFETFRGDLGSMPRARRGASVGIAQGRIFAGMPGVDLVEVYQREVDSAWRNLAALSSEGASGLGAALAALNQSVVFVLDRSMLFKFEEATSWVAIPTPFGFRNFGRVEAGHLARAPNNSFLGVNVGVVGRTPMAPFEGASVSIRPMASPTPTALRVPLAEDGELSVGTAGANGMVVGHADSANAWAIDTAPVPP